MSLRFPVTTRFAPTPSGELHLGHVLAAWEARRLADVHGGRCLLRIEDLDAARSRDPFVLQRMLNDLEWIGLHFDGEMVRQSERTAAYSCALDKLRAMGLLYPCFCSRSEIRAEWGESPELRTVRRIGATVVIVVPCRGISWRRNSPVACRMPGALICVVCRTSLAAPHGRTSVAEGCSVAFLRRVRM